MNFFSIFAPTSVTARLAKAGGWEIVQKSRIGCQICMGERKDRNEEKN
jgi:hypothetical protein